MCGIIGQLAFGEFSDEMEKVRQESMIFLGSELLQMTQDRGKDATGACLLFDDGNFHGLKMGIPAIEFISRYGKTDKEYGGFIKVWRKSKKKGKIFLGHCRATTRGCSLDNKNNHPVIVDEVIGVHNGTIQNDDIIFEKLGCERIGAVDSEAIFRLLHHYTKNGTEPFTTDIMKETVKRLTGSFAVLAFSGNNPYQICGFRDRKPLEMALIKPLKLVVCASDKKFIETSVFRYNKMINLYITGPDFPTLKSNDVVYKTLQDDSAVIFDLRTEINKDTDLEDLYNWEKMPRTKEWTTASSAACGYNTQSQFNNRSSNVNKGMANAAGVKTTLVKDDDNDDDEQPNHKNSDAGSSDGKCQARIWMSALKGYVPEDSEEAKVMKKLGNVEVDIDKGTSNEIDIPKKNDKQDQIADGKFALEEVGAEAIDKDAKIKPAPVIKILDRPKKGNAGSEPSDDDNEVIEGEVFDTTAIEADSLADAEAIEAAEEETKRLEQYENIDEIIADLEIKDTDTLEQIPTVSLVNRINKFIMREGVYRGYLRRKKEETDAADRVALSKKKQEAETNIRSMKAVVRMLLGIIQQMGYVNNNVIEKVVAEALSKREEVSKEKMDNLFTEGDKKIYHLINRVREVVAEKEDR